MSSELTREEIARCKAATRMFFPQQPDHIVLRLIDRLEETEKRLEAEREYSGSLRAAVEWMHKVSEVWAKQPINAPGTNVAFLELRDRAQKTLDLKRPGEKPT